MDGTRLDPCASHAPSSIRQAPKSFDGDVPSSWRVIAPVDRTMRSSSCIVAGCREVVGAFAKLKAQQQSERSEFHGIALVSSSTPSHPRTAPTSSSTQAMRQLNRRTLQKVANLLGHHRTSARPGRPLCSPTPLARQGRRCANRRSRRPLSFGTFIQRACRGACVPDRAVRTHDQYPAGSRASCWRAQGSAVRPRASADDTAALG